MTLAPVPWLAQIAPYVPGQPAPSEAGRLASNESALGTPAAALEAVSAAAEQLFRYPDPLADELRLRLGREFATDPDQIVVGNGSDELIYLLALAYLAGGRSCVTAAPSYRIHEIAAQIVNASIQVVPLKEWRHDLAAMAQVDADIAFICNPHNPTGTTASLDSLDQFRARMVVVDEAYVDFSDDPIGAAPLAREGKVVVLRTFSKLFGLAGARIGYLIGPREVIEVLRKIRPPFSVNPLGQAAALAALDDASYRERARTTIAANRSALIALFQRAGYECVPSQANFVLVVAPDEAALLKHLRDHGVSVRPGTTLGLPGAIRVTVPNDEGLALLRGALAQ